MLDAARYTKAVSPACGCAFGLAEKDLLVRDLRALADAIENETCIPQKIRTDTEAAVDDFTFQTLTFKYAIPANRK
jgi:hypothetical protein